MMKTIGLIGGMSPASTLLYYQQINQEINTRLGSNASADLLLHSLNFEPIVQLQKKGDWKTTGEMLAQSAWHLEQSGADFLALATNTMHKVAPAIEQAVEIPLLHIVDATAEAIRAANMDTIALLGTRFTMSDSFYRERLQRHGIHALVPDEATQHALHSIIFDELCLNQLVSTSQRQILQAIAQLRIQGAEGVILGCTELCLAVNAENSLLPVFDSTTLHTQAIVNFALR